MTSLDLIRFRRDRKWSQQKCASELGCSRGAIRNWEMGRTSIPKSIALAIAARAFQLKPFGDK